jgi:hypothetical protein
MPPKPDPQEIIALERAALDRWGKGDPGGFLELYDADVTYYDPGTSARIDGHRAMTEYYAPFTGKIAIRRYEMIDPHVAATSEMAVLTYRLNNFLDDGSGGESLGPQWNSTVVFRRTGDSWKSIHSHWSYTRHPAFQNQTPEDTEKAPQ